MSIYLTKKVDGQIKKFKVASNGAIYNNVETVYDMTSSDSSINWGYTSGIQGGVTISGKDFSKYDKLVFTGFRINMPSFYAELDLSAGTLRTSGWFGRATSTFQFIEENVSYVCCMEVLLTYDKTSIISHFTQNTSNRDGDSSFILAKIEGVLKTPSMIYTGEELTEGNGIIINNGTISSKCTTKILWSGSKTTTGDITLTDDLNNYTLLILTGLNNNNEYASFCIVTSTIVTATSSSFPYDMGNSTYTANRYVNLYYKDQRTLTIKSLGGMTLRWVEGVI